MNIANRVLDTIFGRWKLQGYDTFSLEYYPLPGRYWTEGLARMAAKLYLRHLERTQPSAFSGGQTQAGIQDRVYIVRPDETEYRYVPADRPR
jgi:hypothetical protein